MRILEFDVDKQKMTKQGDFSGLIAGSKGYLKARFSFSSEWNGYRKAAVFKCPTGEYPVLINGCMCDVPDEAAACTSFKVHVVGKRGGEMIKCAHVTVIQRRC